VDLLTGYARQALSRTITKQYKDARGDLTVVVLSPGVEDLISRSVQHTEFESYVVADPDQIQRLVSGLQKYVHLFTGKGLQPIVLCSPQVRPHFRKIIERFYPNFVVLSHNEITREVNIKSLGMVEG
jgi:flagellar biosynthesis protein FlhA